MCLRVAQKTDVLRNFSVRLAIYCVVAACSTGYAQLSPEDSLAAMKTIDGLEVELFAAEEALINPTCMDIDAQGRVWVCEAANYRLFNQPASRAEGDRIRVLEDTDGDGRCDKAWTYYQDPSLQAAMGIAVVGDRVYICQSPELFYLEDTDNDGKADKKTVILSGFAGVDHDHAIHGVMIGPDGKLYMTNGDRGLDVTDKSGNRILAGKASPTPDYDAATVLRTDLEGLHLELLAEGMRNPYEPTVNSFGTVFGSDNDDDGNEQVQINYVMEGGHYGYWPRREGDRHLDEVHWNKDRAGVVPNMMRTGFGSPCGILYYEGHALLPHLNQTLIHADAGPGVVRSYRPIPNGAGYRGEMEILLSCEGDPWFRPVDVTVAPDGSLFVADWYDPGVGGHRMGDFERGRIYRLAKSAKQYNVPVLDLQSPGGIQEAFTSPNLARRYLGYAALHKELPEGNTAILRELAKHEDPSIRARTLWLLAEEKKGGRKVLLEAARDADPAFRVLAVRLLALQGPDALYAADWLLDDPNPMVRRQLLLSVGQAPDSNTQREWLIKLALHYDGKDRFYREAIGIAFQGREAWGYEALQRELGEQWDSRLAGLAIQLHPPTAKALAQASLNSNTMPMPLRIAAMDALDAIGTRETGAILARHATHPKVAAALFSHALRLLSRDAGRPWAKVMNTSDFDDALIENMALPERSAATLQFALDARREGFLPIFTRYSLEKSRPLAERLEALTGIERTAPKVSPKVGAPLVAQLVPLLSEAEDTLHLPALSAINAYRGPVKNKILLGIVADADRSEILRAGVVKQLGNSQSGAIALLNLVEQGTLPQDLKATVSAVVHRSNFEDVRMMAEQLLPLELTKDGEALPPIEVLVAMSGDPVKGREIFFSEEYAQCYRCHKIGDEGKEVGPALTVIGQKVARDGLLESILFPSAAIAHEYEVWIIETEWDGFLSGFILSESRDEIQFMDSSGVVTPIKTADILERRKSSTSLMPTGLATALTAQDLSDLVAFLAERK